MSGLLEMATNFHYLRRPLNSSGVLRKIQVDVITIGLLACARSSGAFGQNVGPKSIRLDEAIQIALQHNHSSQNAQYLHDSTEGDVGLSYLLERGKKRQHRLQAAKDITAQTRSQVKDSERGLIFNTASLFVGAQLAESTLELADKDLKSFQKTVDLSQLRYDKGAISEDDYLKIKLQLLQFETDYQQAELAKVQALSDLRQLLGYESVPGDYDVAGPFEYEP